MSDEEDDYMSDKFLNGLQDVRPSLINNRAKKRQIDVEAKHDNHIKRQKEKNKLTSGLLDNESLQTALSKPLAQENKGFKLLAKMGYKPGQALGKAVENEETVSSTSKRLVEPLGFTLKTDRQGLGREAALQELNERRKNIRQQRLRKHLGGETSIEEFRRRTTKKHEEIFVLNALRRCQKVCENLDIESNIKEPEMQWFWPERIEETREDDTEEGQDKKENKREMIDEEVEEFSSQEKLEMLTSYIRTSYLFCYWCGVRYNDSQDLKDHCPGLTKDDH